MTEFEGVKETRKAGKILKKALDLGEKIAKPGMKLEELADKIESFIRDEGGEPAFPANLDVNEVAAHYTPKLNDPLTVPEKALLKIDLGVHVDGYVTDAARTVDFSGEWGKLIEATDQALENAVSMAKPGIEVSLIGKEIEDTILKYGFKPLENLGGHGIGRWVVHQSPSIPNIHARTGEVIPENSVIAIEPFATNGFGRAVEAADTEIYDLLDPDANARSKEARKVIELARKYNGLPFAKRWVEGEFTPMGLKRAFKELEQRNALRGYPALVEKGRGMVSQSEASLLVFEDHVELVWE